MEYLRSHHRPVLFWSQLVLDSIFFSHDKSKSAEIQTPSFSTIGLSQQQSGTSRGSHEVLTTLKVLLGRRVEKPKTLDYFSPA